MNKKGLRKFIAGAAIGVGIGLLFAPKKGSETRKDLKNKACEITDTIKNIDKDDIKNKLQELKKDLENLDKETAIEIIKEKSAAIMKKADELIETAKKKSAPFIEKAANEIKSKTVVILKSALEKLEPTEVEEPKSKKRKSNKKTNNVKTA